MDRRSFIKGLIALASAPAIGKYVNIFKTEGAREGIEQIAGQGVDFFNMVIKKVMDEGTLVKEEDRISTFKHPDRPDITVDVDQTTGSSSVYFDTDQGTKAVGEIQKTMDETTGGKVVEELFEQEEIYGPTGRDAQEGISGGITNLEKFLKGKRGFAMGGRVGMFRGGVPKAIGGVTNLAIRLAKGFMKATGRKPNEDEIQKIIVEAAERDLDDAVSSAKTPGLMSQDEFAMNVGGGFKAIGRRIEDINKDILIKEIEEFNLPVRIQEPFDFAAGGRVGMFRGGVPKGLEAALRAIMGKFGDDAITTADKAPQPAKTTQEEIMDFNARNPNPNRQMTDEEITEFADEFGLDPSEEYYNWDGTLADAKRLLKESEDETKYMYQQYKAGRLDPKPGEKGREKFLENKLEEAELSGESKLITRDEIEELEELKAIRKAEYKPGDAITSENFGNTGFAPDLRELKKARELAPKMTERLELKARYPGITDELLDSILIDDNPQRKAEVLATLDEIFTMMNKGKGADEILSMFKNINRTKQADGGSIDGDVSLTVIKIPDISESGVESLFKRR